MLKDIVVAKNVKDALAKNSKGYCFFAGGTEIARLNSSINNTKFVSLRDCELSKIEKVDRSGKDFLKIGSATTFQSILLDDKVPACLKDAIKFCFSLQKRNMATIGGNIASLRDDSYLVATLMALKSELEINGKVLTMEEYGNYLKEDRDKMLITSVYIPLDDRIVYSKRYSITASSSSTLTLSLSCERDFSNFCIVACIKTYGIVRLYDVEKYLEDKNIKDFNEEDFENIVSFIEKLVHITLKDDLIYGSAKYKKYLLATSVRLAIESIMEN